MSQLRQQQTRLEELNVDVKIVVFDNDFMAKAYVAQSQLTWPLLLDSERKLYSAYGMLRGNSWTLYNPIAIAGYVRVILRGTPPGRPGKDWGQLGGDVVIDPDGIIRLHHVSTDPHDRPSMQQIFDVIEGNAGES